MSVYHYCSVETFYKIITNKSLRLSDITKSNDSMEVKWLTRNIYEAFADKYFDTLCSILNGKVNESKLRSITSNTKINDTVENLKNIFFDDKKSIYSFYVCCFSGAKDLLSQWRGYADDGKGVAIGFNQEMLKSIGLLSEIDNNSINMFFDRVSYNENEQIEILNNKVQEFFDELIINYKRDSSDNSKTELDFSTMALIPSIIALPYAIPIIALFFAGKKGFDYLMSNQKQDKLIENIGDIMKENLNRCFFDLIRSSIIMKNPFFSEEKEFRLCLWVNNQSFIPQQKVKIHERLKLKNLEYGEKRGSLVSYYDLDFSNCSNDFIEEVIIGPKSSINKLDVLRFLKSNNINLQNLNIVNSSGTYR